MNNKKTWTMMQTFKIILSGSIIMLTAACHKTDVHPNDLKNFNQVNLVANLAKYNPVTVDPTLINGFGLAWSPTGIAWVNSVGGHVSELYNAEGDIVRKPVSIPSPTDSTGGGFPTGIVFSGGKGFNLRNGPSVFLFTGFDGVLSGWNPASVDNAKKIRNPPAASYTGLALSATGGRNFIYAANFGVKRIDVWDTAFARVSTMPFVDPELPADYSPYNIQAIGDLLFVVYAKLGTDGHGVQGKGNGFVSVFTSDGTFIKRFASGGTLDIPWGITAAPKSFLNNDDIEAVDGSTNDTWKTGNDGTDIPVILVGNFGDGRINVFNIDGRFIGQLRSHNHVVEIDGLWALSFAPSSAPVDPSRLYFTAGPAHETDGLFGYLIKQ
jgi:uncharacterized protein (TIGR03118 family)